MSVHATIQYPIKKYVVQIKSAVPINYNSNSIKASIYFKSR